MVTVVEGDQQQVDRVRGGGDLVADLEVWPVRCEHLVAQVIDHRVGGDGELVQLGLDLVGLGFDIEQPREQAVRALTTGQALLAIRQQAMDATKILHLQEIEDLAAYRTVLGGLHLVGEQAPHPVAVRRGKRVVEADALFDGERPVLFHRGEDGLVAQYAHGTGLR